MRCLYCGKELALLKRWTGGGEFCSDAHRQQYQEEYNQLALTRLLQAKPQAPGKDLDKGNDAEPSRGKAPAREAQPVSAKSAGRSNGATPSAPQPVLQPVMQEAAAAKHAAVAIEPEPELISEPVMEAIAEPEPEIVPETVEEPAPAEMSSFLLEIPVPLCADVMVMSRPETEFEYASSTELPRRERFEEWATQLVACGPVEITRTGTIADSAPRMNHERRVEIRDFVRTTPIVEVDLSPAGETVIPPRIDEPLEVATVSCPPQANPELWTEHWREFSFEQSLGALARATFRTTGLQDNEDASDPVMEDGEVEPVPAVAAAPVAEIQRVEPVVEETVVEETPNALPDDRASKDAVVVEEPVVEEPARREEPIKAEEPVKEEPTGPAPAIKPLPMTLHGLAAGRGKPVQVFTAVASAIDVHVPRSNALPLRPVMTLGPAPAIAKGLEKATEKAPEKTPEKTVVVKVDPKKTAKPEIKPDPKQANGKGKKEAVPEKPVKKEEVKPAAKVEPKVEAKSEPKSEPKVEAKPEPKAEPKLDIKLQPKQDRDASVWKDPTDKPAAETEAHAPVTKHGKLQQMPAPLAVPYTTPDLGLPSLNLDTSGGFWKRLPIAGKLMLIVTVVGLALGVMYIIKSAGGPAASGPQVVATALPDDGEWILDWGSEPGVRRTHDLYIRKSSLTLSDYRIEFKEQLENKALGWVYRAKDSKNFYVARVEAAKPGVDTTFAVVHWAVVDGQEQTHVQTPMSLTPAVHLDTVFKIKFDAIGDHFTTWVQDQKVDEWSDSRFKTGGAGLYNEHGAKPVSLNLSLLVQKK